MLECWVERSVSSMVTSIRDSEILLSFHDWDIQKMFQSCDRFYPRATEAADGLYHEKEVSN